MKIRIRMGLCSTIFVVLLILKLCGVLAISWWWVCAPLFVVVAFWCLIMPMLFAGAFCYGLVKAHVKKD